jgi:hypothetical protein
MPMVKHAERRRWSTRLFVVCIFSFICPCSQPRAQVPAPPVITDGVSYGKTLLQSARDIEQGVGARQFDRLKAALVGSDKVLTRYSRARLRFWDVDSAIISDLASGDTAKRLAAADRGIVSVQSQPAASLTPKPAGDAAALLCSILRQDIRDGIPGGQNAALRYFYACIGVGEELQRTGPVAPGVAAALEALSLPEIAGQRPVLQADDATQAAQNLRWYGDNDAYFYFHPKALLFGLDRDALGHQIPTSIYRSSHPWGARQGPNQSQPNKQPIQ